MNNNYKISNTQIYNTRIFNNEYQSTKYRSHSKNNTSNISTRNTSNISTRNTEYYDQFIQGRQIISNNRMFDVGKTSEHFKLFNQSSVDNNKGNMYKMQKTSRLHEFITERRKVLLDSQPKPESLEY